MSRNIRISKAKKNDFMDIEDVDELLDESKNVDASGDHDVPGNHDDLPDLEEMPPAPKRPIYDARKPVKHPGARTATLNNKGKRTIYINELDPNIIPPSIEEFKDPLSTGSKIAVIGKPGCFAPGTKIRMFDGRSKKVEDVGVGELVMGDDFTPRRVIDLCRGTETMYRVSYAGGSVIVNENHILSLRGNTLMRDEFLKVASTRSYVTFSAEKRGCTLNVKLIDFLEYPQGEWKWYTPRTESGFSIENLERGEYFGFELDGNHLFQLEDGSIVHNTGKSTMIKSLLFEKSEIAPCVQVYSGTEDSNQAYSAFIPSIFIFNAFSQTSYVNFIRRQKLAKKHLEIPWAIVIWDDITEDERIFNLPVVKGTYKNGRHWKIPLHILSLQYALDVKPVIRTNIDGSFILRESNKRNRKVLFENYASAIDDYADFCSIMDKITNDYTALYIHNRTQSNEFEDCIYYYKARDDIPIDFKFGCRELWMFHEKRMNPRYVDPVV